MAMKMFKRNPDGLASVGDRIRGVIALVFCIGGFTCAYHATDAQFEMFFMLVGGLSMLTVLGIMFKDFD